PAKKRHSRLILTLILVTLITALIVSLLPQALGYGLKKWISEQGGEQVTIGNIDFNPFTAELRIENLIVTREAQNQLTLPALELQLEWLPLWKRQIVITGIQLSETRLQLQHNSNGQQLVMGGMTFDLSSSGKPQEKSPWELRLEQISLKKSRLIYSSPQLNSSVTLNQLTLSDLNTADPEKPLKLSFEGTIDNANINLKGEATPLSTTPAFNGHISLKALSLATYTSLFKSHIQQSKGTLLTEGTIALQQSPNRDIEANFNGTIELSDFLVASPSQQLTGEQLTWKGTLAAKPNNYTLEGKLGTKAMTYQDDTQRSYKQSETAWSGTLAFNLDPQQKTIKGNGQLTLKGSSLQESQNLIEAGLAELSLQQGSLSLSTDEQQATIAGKLAIHDSSLRSTDNDLSSKLLKWEGTTALKQTTHSTQVTSDGTLNGEILQLIKVASSASVGYEAIQWQGVIDLEQTAEQIAIKPTGNLSLQGLNVKDNSAQLGLLSIGSIELQQLHHSDVGLITSGQINAEAISIGNALDNSDLTPQLQLAALTLKQIHYSLDSGLSINEIEATDLKQQLSRATDKSWNFDSLTQALQRLSPANENPTDPPSEPMPIQIGLITLLGDNQISFQDKTTEPAFETQLVPTRFTLTNIDSRSPEKVAQVELKGRMGESTLLDLNGTLTPFADKSTFDLQGRIEGLELPLLSSYTAPLMGYKLQSGKANSDIKLSANAGKLEGSSDLIINQLEVDPLSAEKMAALQTQLSIPLETALGMLKDKNNQIKLNLPISGDTDNINVDPSDAINQAIGRAMKKGAKTYLATALFPFGTLLTLVELAGDAAAKVQLDPIPFESGSSQINADQYAYLEKVAQLLSDRPEIHIRLCGVSVNADRLALQQQQEQLRLKDKEEKKAAEKEKETEQGTKQLPVIISDEQLNSLAAERALAIERHLAKKHQIKGDRLISCLPRIEEEKQASLPRADLLI
ncbi:MAG: DUF748 domain-containing protein, partial [Sedimenticola sp.]|nr:DUF748 domain-containing protein [Sedimenticola sp.]